jgi:hypothetical protein
MPYTKEQHKLFCWLASSDSDKAKKKRKELKLSKQAAMRLCNEGIKRD